MMLLAMTLTLEAWAQRADYRVVPLPAHIASSKGDAYRLTAATRIVYQGGADMERNAKFLAAYISEKTHIAPATATADKRNQRGNILLRIDPKVRASEGYRIEVTGRGVVIAGSTPQGVFYGIQTVRKSLPILATATEVTLPATVITDAPRFGYRGMHLDCVRHFFTVDFIKEYIDLLALHNMNRFHWHLTDDQGWRIEIKKYPRLTQVGAWRTGTTVGRNSDIDDGQRYGGYYTQKQLRQLVKYASRRGVTIVPEIEMPAHSEEVTAAYPELSCTHDPKGQPDFCPGNEGTFTFLQNVLAEVMDVFPSTDIHVGGDEAGKAAWPTCSLCRQRVKDEGLPSVQALQGYLIRRIAAYARERGRRIIAWDEVLDDSMPTDVQVMIWRDTTTVRKAIARGHDVILAPGAFCYLDAYQDDPSLGPEANGAYRPLSRVYGYRPLAGLSVEERSHIRGIQGCLWTEYVPTPADVERMLLPRLLAIAENGWTGGLEKDYASFRQRAVAECNRLRAQGIQAFDLGAEVGDRPASRQPVWHKARGAKVIYHRPYNNTYTAGGETALTDGRRGGWDYGAGSAWQGFISRGRIDLTLDLGKVMDVRRVAMDFFQSAGPEIYLPSSFRIAAVDEAGQETELVTRSETTVRHTLPSVETWGWQGEIRTRYLHIQANSGPLGGWLFTDEIIVE